MADPGKEKLLKPRHVLGTGLHSFVRQRDLYDVADREALLHRHAAPHGSSSAQPYCPTQKGVQRVKNGFASHLCLQVAAVGGSW